MTIEEYTENNSLRAKNEAIEMFNMLNKCLGRKVSCCVWNNDEIDYIDGRLEEVNDFSNVVIDGQKLELIGEDKGVINIKLDNSITLYKNSHIIGNNHHGLLYDIIIKKKMYGYDYCQKEWLVQEEQAKKEFNLEKAKDALKSCTSECVSLRDEINHKNWENLVDKCVVDYDTYKIFNAASGMIKDLDNGICFNVAENRMHSRTPILSQLQVYEIAEVVVAFYQKGESYREYWQNSNDTLKKWVKQKIITGEKSKKCDNATNN